MRLLVLCLAMLIVTPLWATPSTCTSSGTCEVGTSCTCTVPPDSSQDRYFYIEFTGLDKGHIYQCKMSNSMGLTFIVATAKVPDGSSLSCGGSCQRFPVDLIVDTRELVKPTDSMLVKYFVAGTDMPTDVRARCDETN
jgi:hypothetical protein